MTWRDALAHAAHKSRAWSIHRSRIKKTGMLRITNRDLRRALLSLNELAPAPEHSPPRAQLPADPICETVRRLGFVQIDPVSAVERAHHHILFTRNRSYRQATLKQLLEKDRALFENWTHDAAVLPTASYPYWKHYLNAAASRQTLRVVGFGRATADAVDQTWSSYRPPLHLRGATTPHRTERVGIQTP